MVILHHLNRNVCNNKLRNRPKHTNLTLTNEKDNEVKDKWILSVRFDNITIILYIKYSWPTAYWEMELTMETWHLPMENDTRSWSNDTWKQICTSIKLTKYSCHSAYGIYETDQNNSRKELSNWQLTWFL